MLQDEDALMILNPLSSSTTGIYALSRNYVYNIHKKFEKYYEKRSWSFHYIIRYYTAVQVILLVTEMLYYNFDFC